MSELRERFRVLDGLEVPDVLARARSIGPRPPDPEPAPLMPRIGVYILAAVIVAIAVFAYARVADSNRRPGDRTPTPTLTVTPTIQRRGGEALWAAGSLFAVDPQTERRRVLVDDRDVSGRIDSAAWSGDGRWVAFEIRGCSPAVPSAGLWVLDAPGQERRLLDQPCGPDRLPAPPSDGAWAWSPKGAQLAIERESTGTDSLIVIDAETGDTVDLGPVVGDLTALAWAPDGKHIAYGTLPSGSVYVVDAQDGSSSLLADGLGYTWGIGSPIKWAPDGRYVLVQAADISASPAPDHLFLMEGDGSNIRELAIDVHDAGVSWSPDGRTIALSSFTEADHRFQMWTMSPTDDRPTLIFESAEYANNYSGGGPPVWSPDGTRLAIKAASSRHDVVWLAVNADGTGEPSEISETEYRSWLGGSYFCECYG